MNALLLIAGIFFAGILLLPPLFRSVAKGKIYTLFIEDDGYVVGKLKRPVHNNEYIMDSEGAYDIVSDRVGLTAFPKGFFPAFFQTIVPCMIYRRDDPIPMGMRNPEFKAITAKEIKIGLEPHFLTALVKTSREGAEVSRWQRMMPVLTMTIAGLALVMIFVLLTKMGALEQMIKLIP